MQILSKSETNAILAQRSEFIKAARPYLRSLSIAVGKEPHATILADSNGIILDEISKEIPAPELGAVLALETAGVNGVGSALREQKYVEIVGQEHSLEDFHHLTAQAIPIFGVKGELVGAVAILRKGTETSERLHEILVCAAHGIEAEQIRVLLDQRIDSFLADSQDLQLMESLRQDVMQLHASVRLKLELAAALKTETARNDVLRLVSGAVKLSREFRQMAGFWLELANSAEGMRQPILLDKKLNELLYLLETEFNTKNASVTADSIPTVWIRYDMRELSRQLLRSFMRILAAVNAGDEVRVSVHIQDRHAEVSLEILGTETKQVLKFPLMARLQQKLIWAPMLPFFS